MPKQGSLDPGVLGSTDPQGNITIRRGLSWAVRRHTLLHESVHRTLTARSGPLMGFRQRLTVKGYYRSGFLRGTEEMLAEGYATYATTGSLRQAIARGISYPFTAGVVTPWQYAVEATAYGGFVAGVPLGAYYLTKED
jgi:hypothetical protein